VFGQVAFEKLGSRRDRLENGWLEVLHPGWQISNDRSRDQHW